MSSPHKYSDAFEKYSFYHCIDLGDGIVTPGIKQFLPIQQPVTDELRRMDLKGKSVLDLGCRDGLFMYECERLGASRVVGIDNDLSPAATEFLIPLLGSSVQMEEVNIYDYTVPEDERYDVVICAGLIYHLRYPFFGLNHIVDLLKPGGILIIETALMLSFSKFPLMWCPPSADHPEDPTSVTYFNHPGLVGALTDIGMEQIECRAIVSPSEGWPRFDGWEAFLAGPDGHFADRAAAGTRQSDVHGAQG